ncbi:30S ribosomal protein S6 [bacterium]|nr:30S ribosomal protein S6 [bacterium]
MIEETTREYECCALFKPDLEEDVLDAQVQTVSDLITERGGKILRVDRWKKRFLAYTIGNYNEGYYVIYRWHSTSELLDDLDYQLRYNEHSLRHLVLDYTDKERKRRKRSGKARAEKV